MSAPFILKLDEQVKKLTPIVLWEGDTNDTDNNVVLSDDISNYKKIKIYFHDNDQQYGSQEIYNNNANEIRVSLFSLFNSGEYFNVKMVSKNIIGNRIYGIGQGNFDFNDKSTYFDNSIYFTRVEGYK